MPLCLSWVQFLRLTTKEHKHGLQNDADDDDAGLQGRRMSRSRVTIVIDGNAATAAVDDANMDPSMATCECDNQLS